MDRYKLGTVPTLFPSVQPIPRAQPVCWFSSPVGVLWAWGCAVGIRAYNRVQWRLILAMRHSSRLFRCFMLADLTDNWTRSPVAVCCWINNEAVLIAFLTKSKGIHERFNHRHDLIISCSMRINGRESRPGVVSLITYRLPWTRLLWIALNPIFLEFDFQASRKYRAYLPMLWNL